MAETAILSVTATNGSNLANLPIKNGQIIFIQDKHKLAFDLDNKRVVYREIIDIATEAGRTSLLAPVSGCYYFVVETAMLWTYRDGVWVQMTTHGVDGDPGQRGHSLLRITTAPSSYTTATGGFTPKYRVSLGTVKTQANVTEVLVGDTIGYSYYQYPVGYVDASYVYLGTRVSIRGATGKTAYQYAQDGGYTGTEAEFAELLASGTTSASAGRQSINKHINFVGMSIWWYDGNILSDSGFGGGVTCRGYQTLLQECFDFAGETDYCYSGFSLGATSASDTSSIMTAKASGWSGTTGDIWTLDTITNDFKRDIPIGDIADYTNATGATTYYGALRAFADRVNAISGSDAIVICSNALRRNNSGYTSSSANAKGHTLLDYEYALVNVAVRNNWYFVDQYRLSGITDETIALTTLDGLHLNNFGYTLAVKPWVEQLGIIAAKLSGDYGSADTPDIDDGNITGETITGYYINSSGVFTAQSSSWVRTDYIQVNEGDDYAYHGYTTADSTSVSLVYGYDASKNPVMPIVAMTKNAARVDSRENGMIFTIPDGVKYIACCSVADESFAVRKLDVTGYVDMAYPVVNYYLTSTGGLTATGATWETSARIAVRADGVYKYYGNTSANNTIPCVCGYDASGSFVSVLLASGNYVGGKEFAVPDGVAYIRYCSVTAAETRGIYKDMT